MQRERPRIEGKSKVSGRALYTGDIRSDIVGSAFDTATPVTSTQSTGVILKIDTADALAVPGVRWVMTHENAPRLRKVFAVGGGEIGSFLPLQDARIRYHGQCIALVIADTLAAAQEGARRVQVHYSNDAEPRAYTLDTDPKRLKYVKRAGIAPGKIAHGNATKDFATAPVQVDLSFHSAPHHHNSIEPTSVIAWWDDDGGLTIHAAIQWHHTEAMILGQAFGLSLADRLPGLIARALTGARPRGKVRLINALSGGSFGRNQNTIHFLLAAMAAKARGRAVRVTLTREQTYSLLSYRGETHQRIRLGAEKDGRLIALLHDADVAKGTGGGFIEPVGEITGKLYAQRSILIRHRVAELDLNAPGWMRAPGETLAQFALESSIDMLAHDRGTDPLDLRLLNYAENDPETGHSWTSKSLKQCYEAGAAAIGWRNRPGGGTPDANGRLLGYGMATSFHPARQFPASTEITIRRDGSAVIALTLAELGQGILTAMTIIGSETLGIPADRIVLESQSTDLPYGAASVGSTGTFSNGAAIHAAAIKIKAALIARAVKDPLSPLHRAAPSSIRIEEGQLIASGNQRESIAELLARDRKGEVRARATTGRTMGHSKQSKGAFGAIFTQVSIDPLIMDVRVERMVGAFACGRILNPLLARNQLTGGMIWGIGQALFEETHIDTSTGQWANANLAEALIPTSADVRSVEAILIDEDDSAFHPLGIKGVGEIGLVGPSAAIGNAIFDATNIRLTSLPMRIEHLLQNAERKEAA